MIEVLVAVLLFSLGVLALIGMQVGMAKNVNQAKLRSEASFLATQLVGQMWVDQPNLARYAIADGSCSTDYAGCTAWASAVQQMLPGGRAQVQVNGARVDITLTWQLPNETPSSYRLGTEIQ